MIFMKNLKAAQAAFFVFMLIPLPIPEKNPRPRIKNPFPCETIVNLPPQFL